MGTTAFQKMLCFSGSQPVGHNPFGGLNDPFTGINYQTSCISDIYIVA